MTGTIAATGTNTFSYTGTIVTDTVLATGTYDIAAFGAQGGAYSSIAGGKGADIEGYVFLTAGETVEIAVGGTGAAGSSAVGGGGGGGGGGGSIVLEESATGTLTPLVVAAGGGGAGNSAGLSGNATTSATSGGSGGGAAGTNEGGGGAGVNTAGGGAGFATNGGGTHGGGDAASGFTGGGYSAGAGGFGGGGKGGGGSNNSSSAIIGGGGGGYNGGGGGGAANGTTGLPGGGGGSFDAGTSVVATAGTHTGNGLVTITALPPAVGTLAATGTNTFAFTGMIALDVVQATGTYDIAAFGGQGGSYGGAPSSTQGGEGADIEGDVVLTQGETIEIAVGGAGSPSGTDQTLGGGGGGGSFVLAINNGTIVPLVIAGGGGGLSYSLSNPGTASPGSATTTAAAPGGVVVSNPNAPIGGGGAGNAPGGGGGGAGLLQDGVGNASVYGANGYIGGGGLDASEGFLGGGGGLGDGAGFGGGGGGGYNANLARGGGGGGGGGGYNGGGGGGADQNGGGGGSFDAGTPIVAIAGANSGNGSVTIASTSLCFCAGTLIDTPTGHTEVENLSPGDHVLTASGAVRPIVWIGAGRVLATRGQRSAATPVIVKKSAFADNVPFQDLRVTKGHAFHFGDVLIPVEFLVNHKSILWDDRAQEVQIFHIELATHDVIRANGAPAETYRDDGNRWLFQNVNGGWHLPPMPPCAPVLTGGPEVDTVWSRLLLRAAPRRNMPLTEDPDLHLRIDGIRLNPAETAGPHRIFFIPGTPERIEIASRDSVPEELGLARDPRSLGVALRRIEMQRGDASVTLDPRDPQLTEGFHAYEPEAGIRWTNGRATLPPAPIPTGRGPLKLILTLGGATRYLDLGPAMRAA